MNNIIRYVIFMAAAMFAAAGHGQNVEAADDSVAVDSAEADSVADLTEAVPAEDMELPWGERLRHRLGQMAKEADDAYYSTGFCVYDLTGDSLLYEYNQEKVMRPASTQKLLTAISALTVLGAGHQYRTQAFYDGRIGEDSVLYGDIYVVGDFDPAFGTSDLRDLAHSISSLGIRRVKGKVYGDVSMKDSTLLGNGWCWDDVPDNDEPYLTPLIVNRGCVTVEMAGGRPALALPSTYVTLVDKTGGSGKFKIDRNWMSNGNTFVATGSGTGSKNISVYKPELYFLHTLCDMLRADSVLTEGYGTAVRPDSASNCIYTCTRTIEQILQRMMKKSDNLYAESMFYQLAAVNGGRWASGKNGVRQVESVMRRAGVSTSYVQVADGSGVSLYNYVSPKAELAMLIYAYRHADIYRALRPSLPIAGVDGTLSSRMRRGTAHANVRAKTGTVNGVSCLAGYCTASNGNLLAFSIMNNGVLKASTGRAFQDRICQEITR